MKPKYNIIVIILIFTTLKLTFAQNEDPNKLEMQKKFNEMIVKEVENYTSNLKLEPWQSFYVDSIINHDRRAMYDEISKLRDMKVSNESMYINCQDKWEEKIFDSFKKVLNEDQWKSYLKSGAERNKKKRDKRKAKAEKALRKLRAKFNK